MKYSGEKMRGIGDEAAVASIAEGTLGASPGIRARTARAGPSSCREPGSGWK